MVEITRQGTWPILKYTLRSEGFYAIVMIDDNYGDILINTGNQIALKHWWGQKNRATKKLREFLCKASIGYLEDKFSYGLDCWSHEEALKNLKFFLEIHFGKPEKWTYEIKDLLETLEGYDDLDADAFSMSLLNCSEFMEIGGSEYPSGAMRSNREVQRFMDKHWSGLVDFWKKELSEESNGKV